MHSISSLLSALSTAYPAIRFQSSDSFRWSPDEQTVFYEPQGDTASLLHEAAHAALQHREYEYDIELLRIEREAWDLVTSTLAKKFSALVDHEMVETMLDTYRDWLHDRSRCPSCEATGIQTEKRLYTCLACHSSWKVNEAKHCALRRYKK